MKFKWIFDGVMCTCTARDISSIGTNYYRISLLPLSLNMILDRFIATYFFIIFFYIIIPHVRSCWNRRELPYLVLVTLQLLQRYNDGIKWSLAKDHCHLWLARWPEFWSCRLRLGQFEQLQNDSNILGATKYHYLAMISFE